MLRTASHDLGKIQRFSDDNREIERGIGPYIQRFRFSDARKNDIKAANGSLELGVEWSLDCLPVWAAVSDRRP